MIERVNSVYSLTQNKSYQNYLQSEHWQKMREKVYKTRKKCRICGSVENLNIHHKKYTYQDGSVLFRETLGVLIVLCNDCHFLWHKVGKKHVMKARYADRIRCLLNLGYSKVQAFQNSYEGNFKKALKINK